MVPAPPSRIIRRVTQVRSEYTSARVIVTNLENRMAGTVWRRPAGYLPPEVDYVTEAGVSLSIRVRDYDVRFLDRVPPEQAAEYLTLIHRARQGDAESRERLRWRTAETLRSMAGRFSGTALAENEHVIPYTTSGAFAETRISNKGSILLDLSKRGFATADFVILSSDVFALPPEEREARLWEAIHDLETLSGRRLADPDNPLLIAMRSAVAEYLPGFMPTYLNVGLTPELLPGLPPRYGDEGAARIRLNSRKTILEALEPETYRLVDKDITPGLTARQNLEAARRIEAIIERNNPKLLWSAADQVRFFLSRVYDYYAGHLTALRNFMLREVHTPAVILQRMVCSVIDDQSYAGVLYSRDPRLGTGVFLQYARAIYGEDLMTGRLPAEERHFKTREETRKEFPAIYHFWDRLGQLESIFQAPVMVEFTGVHGTFTILQVNPAELTGAGMLTATMDMSRAGTIGPDRVRELIKPYHVRQIESDAIDPSSLRALTPFSRGISVLPRSAVSGRLYFSADRARQAREEHGGENIVLARARFTPTDAVDMQSVNGILSLSPAAIHVVTTAQNMGIPALLNLVETGVRIDAEAGRMTNRDGLALQEGDWVTISSRLRTLYLGKASYAPARLLRFMAGEKVDLSAAERPRFRRLAEYYSEYRRILENVDASRFESLQDLGHAIRYGRLSRDAAEAEAFVNSAFDANAGPVVTRLFESTLGTHLINRTAFDRLSPDRKVRLLRAALTEAVRRSASGYDAGAFVIGSFVDPEAGTSFWRGFEPVEAARLLNEWILHQKYLKVLDAVGERRLSRAKDVILGQGLGSLVLSPDLALEFARLKLSGLDLEAARASVDGSFDPQAGDLLDLLMKPWAELLGPEGGRGWTLLRSICEAEGIPAPGDKES
jgi:hypothetical protein